MKNVDQIVEKYMGTPTGESNRFKVGDKVKVIAKGHEFTGKTGVVTSIDGEYHIVKVNYGNKKYDAELYRHEIAHV